MIKRNVEHRRLFIVGSEWLYYNVYIGPQTSDKFLTDTLYPFTNNLINENIIDKWFFIRYKDGYGTHLRIRFHLCNLDGINKIIFDFQYLLNSYLDTKLVSNVTINTYRRELERYGKSTIDDFETLFFINSKLIINIVKLTENDQENRWLYGMKSIDSFLNSLNFDIEKKHQLLKSLKTGFGNEFHKDKNFKKQLSKKQRYKKNVIKNIIENANDELETLVANFIVESSPHTNAISIKLQSENNFNLFKINDLLGSYIHMHCNRLFQSKHRSNEWILYDLLYEYYNSKIARFKYELKLKTI